MKGPPRYLTALVAGKLVVVGSSPLAQCKLTLALQALAALAAQAALTVLTVLTAVVPQAGRLAWPALEALEGQAAQAALTALQVAAALVAQAALEGRGPHLPTPYLAAVGLCPCPPVARLCLAQLPLAVVLLPVVGPLLGVARRLAEQQQLTQL